MKKIKSSRKNIYYSALIIILVGALVGSYLHVKSVHDAQHASGKIPTSKPIAANQASSNYSNNSSGSTNHVPASSNVKLPDTSSSSAAVLIAPFGEFVSNHRPGQNGSPTSEQSVCNTTPGATCDIQFTNSDGVTKDLGATTTDQAGSAYWNWDVNGGTLASGSWKITAVAKYNNQTQTSVDPTPIIIQ